MLVAARFDDGSAMTDSEIRDQLMTLLLAGHETTATSLAGRSTSSSAIPSGSAVCARSSPPATRTTSAPYATRPSECGR